MTIQDRDIERYGDSNNREYRLVNVTSRPWHVVHHHHVDGDLWLSILRGVWDVTHHKTLEGQVAHTRWSAMSEKENLANAYHITRCVNAHEKLLQTVEALLEIIAHSGPKTLHNFSGGEEVINTALEFLEDEKAYGERS